MGVDKRRKRVRGRWKGFDRWHLSWLKADNEWANSWANLSLHRPIFYRRRVYSFLFPLFEEAGSLPGLWEGVGVESSGPSVTWWTCWTDLDDEAEAGVLFWGQKMFKSCGQAATNHMLIMGRPPYFKSLAWRRVHWRANHLKACQSLSTLM